MEKQNYSDIYNWSNLFIADLVFVIEKTKTINDILNKKAFIANRQTITAIPVL